MHALNCLYLFSTRWCLLLFRSATIIIIIIARRRNRAASECSENGIPMVKTFDLSSRRAPAGIPDNYSLSLALFLPRIISRKYSKNFIVVEHVCDAAS